jgi:hypothetical protein
VNIVEADHPNVRSNAAAKVGDCVEDAKSDYVAEADNAVDVGIFGEQPRCRLPCLRPRRLAYHRVVGVEGEAVVSQEFLDAASTLFAG